MSDPVLTAHQDGAVMHLVLNRPAKRNALSAELRSELVDRLDAAAGDDTVGAVLLSGAGEHFCAGFDLAELSAAADPAALFADAEHYHHRVHTFSKPIVAAVAGSAVAGGFDLALMCDLRLARTDAAFGQPQVRHGIPASYELVASVVGDHAARDLCLTGRIVGADEALRIGLVQRVVEANHLIEAAQQLAAEIASMPGAATMKQQILKTQPRLFGAGP